MYYRLTLTGDNYERKFFFIVESENKQRWADMRLIKIEDNPAVNGISSIVYYDPLIHTPDTHHYMSHTWKARFHYATLMEDGSYITETYRLYGAFGNPGTQICLIPTERLED